MLNTNNHLTRYEIVVNSDFSIHLVLALIAFYINPKMAFVVFESITASFRLDARAFAFSFGERNSHNHQHGRKYEL